jgi:hypothetical protein
MADTTELSLFIDGKCRVQSGLTPHGEEFFQSADDYHCRDDLNQVLRMYFSSMNTAEAGSAKSGRVELKWYEIP